LFEKNSRFSKSGWGEYKKVKNSQKGSGYWVVQAVEFHVVTVEFLLCSEEDEYFKVIFVLISKMLK